MKDNNDEDDNNCGELVQFGRSSGFLEKVYPVETFDVIYSRDTILHIQDKPALFRRFFKWLKPGGKIITDYCRRSGNSSEEFAEYIKQRGYDLHDVDSYSQMNSSTAHFQMLKDSGFQDVIAEDRTNQVVYISIMFGGSAESSTQWRLSEKKFIRNFFKEKGFPSERKDGFELRAAREKLERSRRKGKIEPKAKAEREKEGQDEAARRREGHRDRPAFQKDGRRKVRLKEVQQLEEALVLGNGIVFSRTLEAHQYDGHGDKIKLPPSCFTELADKGALDNGPMYFKFLELIGRFLQKLIFLRNQSQEQHIQVLMLDLNQKGAGFSDIPNHKAVLETSLQSIHTVSRESDSALDDIENQYVLIPLALGKADSGLVEEGKFSYYKFFINEEICVMVASGHANIEVRLEIDNSDADIDIYVSRHPLLFPNQHRHEWSSHEMGSKTLILSPKDKNMVAGTYSIGTQISSGPFYFTRHTASGTMLFAKLMVLELSSGKKRLAIMSIVEMC
ncbi:hypothetical protein HPP92_008209 [Vanilla planifolia]|uniref:phosphoethanolamine N-methyltransferase n=1 Tax=Vanilla planifolia TaxID=51239 RepID=A0A835V9G4_VANPL|nr:hypothetical protein HPP92_008209 [Vanilla planifolia]